MENREVALVALRVLSAWIHGDQSESDNVKALRVHALPTEIDLPIDDLACSILRRTAQIVIPVSPVEDNEGDPMRRTIG
jgi:hypothetical protein